ncbi:hypothetical protein ElyMa_006110700 [Elysia marginata]|uniref:Uncharacterized protein n=1 Tax=Elysia marginata TaxID=1093978 RepID=A0AAV4GX06_9GAST|nr:hypothetical protein ElyMa_006110700 [Elysia marginata]
MTCHDISQAEGVTTCFALYRTIVLKSCQLLGVALSEKATYLLESLSWQGMRDIGMIPVTLRPGTGEGYSGMNIYKRFSSREEPGGRETLSMEGYQGMDALFLWRYRNFPVFI